MANIATVYKLPQRYLIVVKDEKGEVLGYDFGRSEFAAGDKIANYEPKGEVKNINGDVAQDFPLFGGPRKKGKKA